MKVWKCSLDIAYRSSLIRSLLTYVYTWRALNSLFAIDVDLYYTTDEAILTFSVVDESFEFLSFASCRVSKWISFRR